MPKSPGEGRFVPLDAGGRVAADASESDPPGSEPRQRVGSQVAPVSTPHAGRALFRLTMLGGDLVVWAVALVAATIIRYEGTGSAVELTGLAVVVGVAAALQLLLGLALKLYRGGYRQASFDEAAVIGGSGFLIGAVLFGMVLAVPGPHLVPLSVPFGGTMAAVLGMVAIRALGRRLRAGSVRPRDGTRTLVFGAGDGGEQLIRSMVSDVCSPYVPVGLLDDDPGKRHLRICGVRVRGTRQDIAAVAATRRAEALVIAVPSGDAALYRDVSNEARRCGLDVKVLPGMTDLLTPSDISTSDVRDIDVSDLLGRHQIDTDLTAIAGCLANKRVLVTGAGGSIGSELCRQLARFGPAELMLLDRDESALHTVQLSLTGKALMDSSDLILADIRDRERMIEVLAQRRPQVVFHAAALKHVPMLEQYPREGYLTNVIGTSNVVDAACLSGVERFINISTDKAANPVNVLGRTKRLAERLTAHASTAAPGAYLSVRFGNVLGSRGSVLTSFAAQIADGGPVTVTDPRVTRYFMTIGEAVQLVIQAAAIGRDAEALVLDMGGPVRIDDVARQLISMADRPVEITYTGLRSGEKLHEVLFGAGELDERPLHPSISQVAVPPLAPSQIDLGDVLPAPQQPGPQQPGPEQPGPEQPGPEQPGPEQSTEQLSAEVPAAGLPVTESAAGRARTESAAPEHAVT